MAHGILALLLAWGADVSEGSTKENQNELVARGVGFATTVRVYEHSLIGPTIQMGRYGRLLRGRAYGAATEVRWDDARVTGLTGGAPINLAYRVEAHGALRLDGMFAGQLTHLLIGPVGIRGHIGPREFGSGVAMPYEIEIPRALAGREPGELAATLPILLLPAPAVARRTQAPDRASLFRVAAPRGWPGGIGAPARVPAPPIRNLGNSRLSDPRHRLVRQ